MDQESDRPVGELYRDYLTKVWREHLNLPRIDVLDDFFEAGGSSMQVIEMLTTVSDRFGKDIDYEEFFKEPCIRRLAELLEGSAQAA